MILFGDLNSVLINEPAAKIVSRFLKLLVLLGIGKLSVFIFLGIWRLPSVLTRKQNGHLN